MAANYSTLEIERLDGLDENVEQIRMNADYSTVETDRLDKEIITMIRVKSEIEL
jgi:hypothetical protein